MIKPVEEMTDGEFRLWMAIEIAQIKAFQQWQKRTWLAMAGAVGLYLLPRFVDFLIGALAVASVPHGS